MLKDMAGIKLMGANFTIPTLLKLFDPVDGNKTKTIKGTLLYGKNGSGKSTIAHGFKKLSGDTQPTISQAIPVNNDGSMITLSEDEKKRIFVFDEEFVDRNVKLQEDHLDTIVMLGERVDLTKKIEEAIAARDSAKIAYDQQHKDYEEFCDSGNVKSPKYYINKLRFALQGDDSWAGRDKEIRGQRQNSRVGDDTYKQFTDITPSKKKNELLLEYEEVMKELADAKTGASAINASVPSIPDFRLVYDDSTIQTLLAKKIEHPELTEREQYLMRLVQSGNSESLVKRLDVFKKEETDSCPYCLQKVTPEYKTGLVQSIERVLSKSVEEHQSLLRDNILGDLNLDLTLYEKLEGYAACSELIAKINDAVKKNDDLLQKKIDNPFLPINIEETNIQDEIAKLVESLCDLEKQRIAHNKQVKSTAPIILKLHSINSAIAHYDVKDLAAQYEKQSKAFETVQKLHNELNEDYEKKKRAVEELEAQRSNITLAIDSINACMKYVFFSENRLRIEYSNGVYKLLSHGHSVKPCNVSVGERNIIGLCYFFVNMLRDQDEKDAYSKEYLIVIDDPISSYDMENKIGILSFLKYKLGTFLEGNANTKALILTHDLMTFYDTQKIFEEIVDGCKQKGYDNPPKFNRYELRDATITQFKNRRQEYTELVKDVFAYGLGEDMSQEPIIGNAMRQMLEAFATFEYKKGIESVSLDEKILSSLNDKEYESYYKNLMYRLVLHGGSHKEDQVKAMSDLKFFSLISDTEKQRTARDVLCYIYLLNKQHLLSHLQDVAGAEATLDSWCRDIKARAAVI